MLLRNLRFCLKRNWKSLNVDRITAGSNDAFGALFHCGGRGGEVRRRIVYCMRC